MRGQICALVIRERKGLRFNVEKRWHAVEITHPLETATPTSARSWLEVPVLRVTSRLDEGEEIEDLLGLQCIQQARRHW